MSTTFTTTTYYSSGSLAGLDSVVFHYDNSLRLSTGMNCNISSILLSALEAQRSVSPKGERQTFGAHDITNVPSKSRETAQPTKPRPTPSKRPRALDLSRPNAKATSKRLSSPSPSSPPPAVRPPTPHALFLFSPTSSSAREPTSPQLDSAPSLSLPSFSDESDPETSLIHSPAASEQSHDIVVLTHHNSPYVPWPSPLRRQYLHTVSPASTQYSRSYSRSGAVAPEPGAHREKGIERGSVKSAFKKLGQKIGHGLRSVGKQMCPKRKSAARTPPSQVTLQPTPSPFLARPTPLRRCSVLSTDSAMTTSLDTWLAERTHALEKPGRNVKFQTLEEYDRCGSWIHVPAVAPSHSGEANASAVVTADSLLSGLSLRTNSYVFPETPSMAGLSPWSPGFNQGQRGCVRSPLRAAF